MDKRTSISKPPRPEDVQPSWARDDSPLTLIVRLLARQAALEALEACSPSSSKEQSDDE